MSLKPSSYNHYTSTADPARTVLFNKFWGSVAVLDAETARALKVGQVADLAPDRAGELHRAGFLVPVDVDEKAAAEHRYLERKQSNALLAITVELTQECNLACPFCYQNSYRGTGAITDQAIDRIQQYFQTVVSEGRRPITDVTLRFIGGEPLMQKNKILATVSGMRGLTDRLGIGLNTQSPEQFKRLYLEVIKIKVEHGETVTGFPRPTFSPCSAYTPYNLKVTADGRLALCDAMTNPRGSTNDLLGDGGRLREIFSDIDSHNPFHDPQCGNCTNVGICGGKVYCKPDPCDFLPFDLDEFLRFFIETYPSAPNRFDLGSPVR